MNNIRIYAYTFILILAGCVQDNLAADLPRLEGRPVRQALAYLGAPAEKTQAGTEITYTWTHKQSGSFDVPNTASYPVVVQNGGHPALAFTQPPASSIANAYDWHCRLDITAKKGIIVHTAYEGNAGGCRIYSDRLKPLIADPEIK